MNKAYVIFPLIGLVIFGGFYWKSAAQFEEREAQQKAAQKAAIEAKTRQELEARKKAIEEANALSERRKLEKAEREAREQREKDHQLKLSDERNLARDDRDRVLRTVDRLRNEVKIEQDALDKIAKDRENALADEAFVQKYIKAAEANQKSLEEVLNKIAAADKAAEEAAKAAAAAPKGRRS